MRRFVWNRKKCWRLQLLLNLVELSKMFFVELRLLGAKSQSYEKCVNRDNLIMLLSFMYLPGNYFNDFQNSCDRH